MKITFLYMFPSPPDIYTRFGQGLLIDLDLSQDPTRFCFLYMQKHVHVNGQFFYVIELQKNKSYIQNKSHVTIHLKNIQEDIYGRSRVLVTGTPPPPSLHPTPGSWPHSRPQVRPWCSLVWPFWQWRRFLAEDSRILLREPGQCHSARQTSHTMTVLSSLRNSQPVLLRYGAIDLPSTKDKSKWIQNVIFIYSKD